jgi:hypothetical protein
MQPAGHLHSRRSELLPLPQVLRSPAGVQTMRRLVVVRDLFSVQEQDGRLCERRRTAYLPKPQPAALFRHSAAARAQRCCLRDLGEQP